MLNELKELGWEPRAFVNSDIKYLRKKLKKMKEDRHWLLIDLHNLGYIGESYKNYTNKELENLLIAAKEKAENRRAAAEQDALCAKANGPRS